MDRRRWGEGGGANVFFLHSARGANVQPYILIRGQMSNPVFLFGGRCPHTPFFMRGQMSGGEHVRPPNDISADIESEIRLFADFLCLLS